MKDVISLGVGEPDFATPWRIREAAIYSLEHGQTTYTGNAGLLALRQRIAALLRDRYGVAYDPETEILVTTGVSEGLDLAYRAILNPGDEVISIEPSYVSYDPGIRFAGGEPVAVSTSGDDEFRLRVEHVAAAISPRTKALMLSYPCNPTGATQTRSDLQALVDLAVRHDLYIVSDEIYDRLTYIGEHVCVASLPGAKERTVLLNGFSKAYAMTGWRIGYVCAPVEVLQAMLKIHQYTALCASHTAQRAAIEAIDHAEEDVRAMVAEYDRRRRFFVRGLRSAGLRCHEPRGAFYAFPYVAHTGLSSEEFATALLEEERVAVVPGNAFGPAGEGYVRCSYATSLDHLEQAVDRIARFVAHRGAAAEARREPALEGARS